MKYRISSYTLKAAKKIIIRKYYEQLYTDKLDNVSDFSKSESSLSTIFNLRAIIYISKHSLKIKQYK